VARGSTGIIAGLVLMVGSTTCDAGSVAVIELFTSQGCSSCPPADEILGELAKRSDVVALTLPVDYWDYLGWRDTLASHAFTERQRSYALARGDGQVYTPQVVVNGMAHAVGSRLADIEAAVEATRNQSSAWQSAIGLKLEGDEIVIDVGSAPAGAVVADGRILLAMITASVEVPITKGENRGQTVTYYNVVRKLTQIGTWTGSPQALRLAKSEYMFEGSDGCTVLLQSGSAGPIVAAARLEDF
jgi:hypothetical protein